MAEEQDLKELYQHKLRPALQSFEKRRRGNKLLYRWFIGYTIFMVVSWIPLPMMFPSATPYFVVFHLIIFLSLGVGNVFSRHAYITKYKQQIIENILNLVLPFVEYFPDKFVAQEDFIKSRIVRKKFACYRGDDLFSGTLKDYSFEFSEIFLGGTSSGKGSCSDPVFQGLFLKIDSPRTFSEPMFITPKDQAGNFEPLHEKKGNHWFTKPKEIPSVKLPLSDFEQHFIVHVLPPSSNVPLLTPALKQALLHLKQDYQCEIHLSFMENQMYCALSKKYKNLFEPRMQESGVQYEDIKEIYDYFTLVKATLQTLHLNLSM